jgi:histidinol-phosphate aminotransferase
MSKPRTNILSMRSYKPPPRDGHAGLYLDANENLLGCSPKVLAAIHRLGAAEISSYPQDERVRPRLARFFGVRTGELLLTNGADDALRLAADAFLELRQSALLVEPTFDMYRFNCQRVGARVISLRYSASLEFPLEEVLRALRDRPRLFWLANPNNPTGNALDSRQLAAILDAATHTQVVIDEAYFEFHGKTVLPLIRRRRNLVVVRTFSKAAGLAGLRLGALFAHRELLATLAKAQPPYGVNAVALAAAEATALDSAFMRRSVREILRSREELSRGLQRLDVRVFPSCTNFLYVDFGPRAPRLLAALARRRIFLRNRSADFGRPGPVRITVGARAHTRRLLRELEGLL